MTLSSHLPDPLLVSFVHGYQDLSLQVPGELLPALWLIQGPNENSVFAYPFPRTPEDFHKLDHLMTPGNAPSNIAPFKKIPRFGFTGLKYYQNYFYLGSWNGIYVISCEDYSLKKIITHPLMCDIHGIDVGEYGIATTLPCKDTVVITDFDGKIIDHFSIGRDLSITQDKSLLDVDWRFIGKMHRGSVGCWHFNYIQHLGDRVLLTSRSANCMVEVNLVRKTAQLRLLNLHTPSLLHDGLIKNHKYHFTSVDGKIFISEDSKLTNILPEENVDHPDLYNRDLVTKIQRISESGYPREPNWCRGIEVTDHHYYTTIDGRYGSERSFGVYCMNTNGKFVGEKRLPWHEVGDENRIRYVTGFDLIKLPC